MATKHTPGPWVALEMSRVRGDANRTLVAICYPCTDVGDETPESVANARLIAAAPDLLELVVAALRFTRHPTSAEAEWRKQALAILSKARGED